VFVRLNINHFNPPNCLNLSLREFWFCLWLQVQKPSNLTSASGTDYHNKDTQGYYLSSYRVINVNKKIFVREMFHLMIMSVTVIIQI